MVWFMPIRILGKASGNCTLNKTCKRLEPNERATSMLSFDTWRMPKFVKRMAGGNA